jgi:hypothetical protein
MSKYLDYERLLQDDVSSAMYNFLVTIYGGDEEREAKAGFPKYFSDEPPSESVRIHQTALARRADEIKRYEDDRRDILQFTCEWFGIKLLDYAGNGGKALKGKISLSPDFEILKPESYDGLTDSGWIIQDVPDEDEEPTDVLVLDVQIVEPKYQQVNNGVTFYLIGIPVDRVHFGKAPVDQTVEERFG